jgi:iron complex transport system substrate-binding protein
MRIGGAALTAVLLLGAAWGPAAPPSAFAQGFPVRVRDATGRAVVIEAPPRRIVSLAPSVTEILFAIGLDHQIVGVGEADDFPPDRLSGRARVGGVVLNVERILALEPDLVIGVPSLQGDQLGRLRELGLSILAVDARTIDETTAQIRLLGLVTGHGRQAQDLVARMERRMRITGPIQPIRVYFELWHEPALAAAGGTLVDDIARRAGGRNVFGDRQGYVQVSLETVLVRNPQVVFLLYPRREAPPARSAWLGTEAGRTGRVHELPPALVTRPGPRIADGLELVVRLLRRGP